MRSHGARQIIIRGLIALVFSSLLFSPALPIPVSAQSGAIRFENISTEQGLSQSTVHAILQDQRGFLWFATEEGLDKFDGLQFTVFKHDPENSSSLSDNIIYSMYQGRDGTLWVGTSIGLDRFDPKTGLSTHYPQVSGGSTGVGGKLVPAILQDRSGMLWVGTDGGGLAAFNPAGGPSKIYLHSPGDTGSNSSYPSSDQPRGQPSLAINRYMPLQKAGGGICGLERRRACSNGSGASTVWLNTAMNRKPPIVSVMIQ
jgi:hypothetical protein